MAIPLPFAGPISPNKPLSHSKFWVLELIDAQLPQPYYGHMILSEASLILLYQISQRETRIFMDVPTALPSASPAAGGIKGHMLNVVLPKLPPGYQQSLRETMSRGRFRSMPNSCPVGSESAGAPDHRRRSEHATSAYWGGMTVAFNDILQIPKLLAPEKVPSLDASDAVLRQTAHFHWERKQGSSLIKILAMALYTLFAVNDAALVALKNGCSDTCNAAGGTRKNRVRCWWA